MSETATDHKMTSPPAPDTPKRALPTAPSELQEVTNIETKARCGRGGKAEMHKPSKQKASAPIKTASHLGGAPQVAQQQPLLEQLRYGKVLLFRL